MENGEELLSITDFAKLAGVNRHFIYRHVREGKLNETLIKELGVVRKYIAKSELEKLKRTIIKQT